MPKTICQARQYSDQMQCGRCGLAWDTNDPDPPECAPVNGAERASLPAEPSPKASKWVGEILRRLGDG